MPESSSCIVLIASLELLPALEQQTIDVGGELLAFSDADALRALKTISARHPRVVALERSFAATPRGSALVNRIKSDPTLAQSEIRIVSHDAASLPGKPQSDRAPSRGAEMATATSRQPHAARPLTEPLDQRGTRRAPRFEMAGTVDVILDGNVARLVDLSTTGAQVLSPNHLKPNQKIRVTLPGDRAAVRLKAVVAWASFEILPGTGPRYRAGLEFLDADAVAVDAFCARHRAP